MKRDDDVRTWICLLAKLKYSRVLKHVLMMLDVLD